MKRQVQRGCRAGQAGHHLRVLVGGVVVPGGVDQLAGRHGGLDRVREAGELPLPVPVPPQAAARDRAVGRVQGGEERGGPVPLLVVGRRRAPARLHGQPGPGAVEGLDPRLPVDRGHDRVRRRGGAEADDVAQLGGARRVPGQLEGPHPVRPELARAPDPPHRAGAGPGRRGRGARGPGGRPVPRGGSVGVSAATRSIVAGGRGGTRGGRVWSRGSPGTPSRMNRSCQRRTHGLDVPVRRAIRPSPGRPRWPGRSRPAGRAFAGCSGPPPPPPDGHGRRRALTSTLIPSRTPGRRGRARPSGTFRPTRASRPC